MSMLYCRKYYRAYLHYLEDCEPKACLVTFEIWGLFIRLRLITSFYSLPFIANERPFLN